MNYMKRIRELLDSVPARDLPYATGFLDKRDFESLRELVKSDINIIRKELIKKQDPDMEIRIARLRELYAEIDTYLMVLGEETIYDET